MEGIAYKNGRLHVDDVDLESLASSQGTPFYVYSASCILDRFRLLKKAFVDLDPGIRYAVKANSNAAILEMLRAEGCGFDLVSGGELERVLRIGADPDDALEFASTHAVEATALGAEHRQDGCVAVCLDCVPGPGVQVDDRLLQEPESVQDAGSRVDV